MFIREITKRNKGYQKLFVYHYLVESYRTLKGPRQRKLLDLGKLSLPKSKWKSLANRIEEIISGQIYLLETDPEIEPLAQHYASMLMHKDLEKQVCQEEETPTPQYETIDINSIHLRKARSIGSEYVSYSMIKQIGLEDLLKGLGLKDRDVQIAELLIISRMVYPSSEWSTLRWAREMSAVGELLGVEENRLSHSKFYRLTDRILEMKDRIEEELVDRERTIFSLEEKLLLYDLTNTYFESSRESSIKKRGRSKEKRNDCPLVTLGLLIDGDGFPKRSYIFNGSISEPKTLKEVLENIGSETGRLIVMDSGVATEDNLKLIREFKQHYLVVSRSKPEIEVKEEDLVEIRHDQENRVKAYLIRREDELILYCQSSLKKRKESSILQYHQSRFEAELKAASESLHKKRGTKRYQKVLERIGRIKERYSKVSRYYDIQVREENGIVTEINWYLKDERLIDDRFSGKYYLRTSRTDLSEKEMWELYITLTDIEDSFRSMKSELGLRPVYHQKDSRIEGHIFLTVLAYHVVNAIQRRLHSKGIYLRWSTIRDLLGTQQRITTELRNRRGDLIYIRQTTEPESFHYLISHALKIRPKPLGIKQKRVKYKPK